MDSEGEEESEEEDDEDEEGSGALVRQASILRPEASMKAAQASRSMESGLHLACSS